MTDVSVDRNVYNDTFERSKCQYRDHEVPLIHSGTEINHHLAQHLQSLCHHHPIHDRDLIVYYHESTMSFRYGRACLPDRGAIHIESNLKSIPIEIADNQEIQILNAIDIMVFRKDHIPDNWIQGQILGQGAFGCVFEAVDVQNGTRLAVKQIPISDNKPGEINDRVKTLCDEVEMLRKISHNNIVKYMGGRLNLQHQCLYIFMELISSGSLLQLIRNYGPLPEQLICNYIRQIVLGLQHLHANGIVHRDIKSSNILLTTDGIIKLADFGAARQLQDVCWTLAESKSVCGTPGWMAPEIVRQGVWRASSDIWSLGCVMIEMGSGARPWPGLNQLEILWILAHTDRIPNIPDSISEIGQHFIRQCLQIDPDSRPTAEQLLQHPYLTHYD